MSLFRLRCLFVCCMAILTCSGFAELCLPFLLCFLPSSASSLTHHLPRWCLKLKAGLSNQTRCFLGGRIRPSSWRHDLSTEVLPPPLQFFRRREIALILRCHLLRLSKPAARHCACA